jgi:hypothetical protein
MFIKIAERLHPFSHIPGITCLIPGSAFSVQVFPTLLRVYGAPRIFVNFNESALAENREQRNAQGVIECHLPLKGPIEGFTVEQDLERGCVRVFGHTPFGYMRYLIAAEGDGVCVHFEKVPKGIEKKHREISSFKMEKGIEERLSLGTHRSQEWERVRRRGDLKEIFPHWLRLAQMLPASGAKERVFLLEKMWEASENKQEILSWFSKLFQAHFHGIFVPRLKDDQFQGIAPEENFSLEHSSLFLLKESAECLRSLFIREEQKRLSLLPFLPPEFHAGRFTAVRLQSGDLIDMEWSKKLLRRVIFRSFSDRAVCLYLQKQITSFRLRRSLREKGIILSREDSFIVKPQEILYLDRFQK